MAFKHSNIRIFFRPHKVDLDGRQGSAFKMNWLGIVSLTLLFPTTIFGLLTNHQEISDKITDYSFWLLPLLAITAIAFILDGYFTGLKAGASIRNAVLFAFIMGYLPTLGIRAFSFSKIAIARTFLPSMFGLVFNIN